jgi:hypothetical protein
LRDVVEVQAGGRLVEDVERAAGVALGSSLASFTRCASPPDSVVAFCPELDVAQADVVQRLQLGRDRRHRCEEAERVLDRHVEHVAMFLPL